MVETVQVPITDDPEALKAQQEHEEAMIKKSEGVERNVDNESTPREETKLEETPNNESEREDWLPEKFKTKEDLLKSYEELEKKLSTSSKETEEKESQASEETDSVSLSSEMFQEMSQQYSNDGALSEDNYTRLEKAGIPKEIVDDYIAGQQAKVQQTRDMIFSEIGGEENFNAMIGWAKENLSPDEINAYNQSTSGTPEQAKLAIHGLYSRYNNENGISPNLIGGDKADSGRTDIYQSRKQLTEAMRDPRYASDPAYRKAVEEKLSRSSIM